jgi:lysozyme
MTLKEMLILHEGLKLKPYRCPAGKLTIGVGRNLEDTGITEAEAMMLLDADVARCRAQLESCYKWFPELNETRQNVVISMVFNMGLARFNMFKKLIAAIDAENWDQAGEEMLASKWATQVGNRAILLSRMMKLGVFPMGGDR